jgi:S-adenosylmethionine:tRNA ribosyltransferase-isomerase
MLTLDDFDFDLPGELIAQHPTANAPPAACCNSPTAPCTTAASASFRNCRCRRSAGVQRYARDPGAPLRPQGERWPDRGSDRAHRRCSPRRGADPRQQVAEAGSRILLEETPSCWSYAAAAANRTSSSRWNWNRPEGDLWSLIERHGRLPLPPYITHAASSDDEARYQTVLPATPAPSRRPLPACISTRHCSTATRRSAASKSPG